ncbi:hypothetical protein COO60DRAFT_797951 [Scenedesmus sp. NREL 46B-D3]|nr:hypothetical protein COO60DRAFT_797951 [Scenedesmus sp. NREL 46B-D3]
MAGANGFINTGGAIDQAVAALPETISALFCSAAEAHAVLQAASWLQQLGQKCEHKPLQGAIVGLQQQSSRKAGLLRMRLLLVRHGRMALGSGDGLLQESSTQLTCCGSAAAAQDVVVTLEALVKQLPPGSSADDASAVAAGSSTAAGANSSISSACWQSAVKQMQRETPVLGTKQQVAAVMLRLACYFTAHAALQPVQQLLAAHGYAVSAVAPLLQPPSSHGSTPGQHLQGACPQLRLRPEYTAAAATRQEPPAAQAAAKAAMDTLAPMQTQQQVVPADTHSSSSSTGTSTSGSS